VLGRDAGSLLEASLRRLGLDHVDLYLIHWPNRWAKGQWKALQKAKQQGLAKAIGVSNFGISHLQELEGWGGEKPAVNQVNFNPFSYRRALREYCEERGIVFEAYASLTQSHRIDDPTVARIAQQHGRTPAQVLLRWAVQRDVVVIPKSLREERIRENAQIFDFELSVMDMGALDALDETNGTGDAL
jgi:diketogulonate reductase-like aldo/keto reductase